MNMTFLYKAAPERGEEWRRQFETHAPELTFRQWPDIGDPSEVRYLGIWEPPADLVARFPNLELIFSLGAGVDQIDMSAIPANIPLIRMQEPGIRDAMQEYVTMAVLAAHRNLLTYIAQQRREHWQAYRVYPAEQTTVGVLGLGHLGRAAISRLATFGFRCRGWSRSRHNMPGIDCFAGSTELQPFLAECDILVCLLPLTEETRGILDSRLFEKLPHGARIINVGRGGHLITDDLLSALNSGQVGGAVLDVCDPEPLPPDHPLWHHPRVLITPHVASMTQPETAMRRVLEAIHCHREGSPLPGVVDRQKGY